MKLGRKSCDSVLEKTCVSFQSNLTYQQFFVKLTNIDRKLYTSFRLPCYRLQREFSLCMCNIINKTSENEDFIASCKIENFSSGLPLFENKKKKMKKKKTVAVFFSFLKMSLPFIFGAYTFPYILFNAVCFYPCRHLKGRLNLPIASCWQP